MNAMIESLVAFKSGRHPDRLLEFGQLREIVGFGDYDEEAAGYRSD